MAVSSVGCQSTNGSQPMNVRNGIPQSGDTPRALPDAHQGGPVEVIDLNNKQLNTMDIEAEYMG